MALDRVALEALGREQLIQEARQSGVRRPEVMTRVELIDEMLRLGTPNPVERKRVRGWLGVARDLVASVVEQGLNLPDAAALIRGDFRFEPLKPVQPPVATVTLAEIYGAQGHFQKALAMLDEVLAKEPEHEAARKLRNRLERERTGASGAAAAPAVESAVFPEEPEPLTPRRLSKQPPAPAEEPEPVTPRRADEPPAFATAHVPDDEEPLTPRRLSKQPPAFATARVADEEGPVTPRRLSKQPPPAALPATDRSADVAVAGEAATPASGSTEDGALLVRTSPTRAVVYFEIREGNTNGDAPLVQVLEWRSGPTGVERVGHEFVVSGREGAVIAEGLSPDAVVRAAIGKRRHGRFKPLAVCAEAKLDAGTVRVVWSPRPRADYAAIAERAARHVAP